MIEYFSMYFFVVPIQILSNIYFIASSIAHLKRIKFLSILLFYSILSLCQSTLGVYFNVFERDNASIVDILESSINAFMLVEFLIFNLFIIKSLATKKFKKIIVASILIFIIIASTSWLKDHSFSQVSPYLTVLEAFLIIISCLLYYYEKFTQSKHVSLTSEPSFFVITGMLLLSAFLTPLSIYLNDMYVSLPIIYNVIYSINSLAYIILFIFFIRALKCQVNIA